MGGPFAYRDADQFGAARYNIEQTRGNDEVVDAQFALAKSGHLKFSDIDGDVGKRTLAAISAYEEAEGVNFYTGELLEAGEDPPASQLREGEIFMISPRLKHTPQAAADISDIEIPGKDAKGRPLNRPVSQIGCLSCAMVSVRDYYSESDIDFPTGIQEFISSGCYNDNRDLVWDRAVSVISDDCGQEYGHMDILPGVVRDWIEGGTPVLCHAGRGHWVVGVGYSSDLGIVYLDPATQFGDGYDDPARNSEKQGAKGYAFNRYVAVHLSSRGE